MRIQPGGISQPQTPQPNTFHSTFFNNNFYLYLHL